jgi:serine/threonine-protein kinase
MMPAAAEFSLGHYQMEKPLEADGLGVVFKARDARNNDRVAVKVLPPGRLSARARKQRREHALALSDLSHPNIAAVIDFGSHGDIDYLVTEYVSGTRLDNLLADDRIDLPRAIALGVQLASGLAAAHAAGVIHGDLKPSSLRVTFEGDLKILNVGVAAFASRRRGAAPSPAELLPALAETLHYIAPERLLGAPADERTDIFSAGAVLYEMACGRPTAPDTHPIRVIHRLTNYRPSRPRVINPWISPAFESLILSALERDPQLRCATAAEMTSALRGLNDERRGGHVLAMRR